MVTDPSTSPGRPRVSVVVATRDRPVALVAALAALSRATGSDDEVVVVDSASASDDTRQVAVAAGVRYERATAPGASLARNLGARCAGGSVLAFTDDDCRPEPGWADAFWSAFDDPAVGLALGPVEGTETGSAADVSDRGACRWRWPSDPAHMGSGASMAVRREAFVAVGGFDERLGPGAEIAAGEDHELFLRLLWAGSTAVFVPGARVSHDDGRTRLATLVLFYGYGVGAGTVAAMARSLDPGVARRLLRARLWHDGVAATARFLARRWEEPAARAAAMTVGAAVGRVRARHLRSTVRASRPGSPLPGTFPTS